MRTRDQRLSAIHTCWEQVRAAHDGADQIESRAALWKLLERYGGSVERYLMGAVRDEDLACELAQEFAVEILKGSFKGADPNRGRFRDFVKGVLQHLVANHFRKGKKKPGHLPTEFQVEDDSEESSAKLDATFVDCWREELLARAWNGLAELERKTKQPYHTVLKHKADHPDQSSEAMAATMSQQLGKAINAPAIRKALQRAREKFADLLLDDLAASLRDSGPEALERELIDLRLYEYCRPALERKRDGQEGSDPTGKRW
jgi:RNA polymerase sigma-70 factor (ECF subfamily)